MVVGGFVKNNNVEAHWWELRSNEDQDIVVSFTHVFSLPTIPFQIGFYVNTLLNEYKAELFDSQIQS